MSIINIFKGDKVVWMLFFFLFIISMVEVYSASSYFTYKGESNIAPFLRHGAFWIIGILAMLVVMNIKCGYFKIATPFLVTLSYILLVVVFFIGAKINGGSRWIPLGGFTFQPSEVAKGTMVLVTAQILSLTQTEKGADENAFKWVLGVCGPMIALIAVENLSTGVLVFATMFMMMVIGRVPMKQIGQLLGVCSIALVLALSFVFLAGKAEDDKLANQQTEIENVISPDNTKKDAKKEDGGIFHRAHTWRNRILDHMAPLDPDPTNIDLLGHDAQKNCSKIAIANSNIIGRGPGNSVQRDFIAQAYSDFIYAIIIEEMGVEGAVFIAMLYIILLFRVGRIATSCENSFPAFLIMGLALMLVMQALFNMCVSVGLAPVTGQPLPLISRGGSSTIINCIFIGVILSVSRTAKKRVKTDGGKEIFQPLPETT